MSDDAVADNDATMMPRVTLVIIPVVGCHYLGAGPWFPFQPQGITVLWPVPNYTA